MNSGSAALSDCERDNFLRDLAQRRAQARSDLKLPAEGSLDHYPQAAVDRRAVRDTLVAQGLLTIHPRRGKPAALSPTSSQNDPRIALAERHTGTIAGVCTEAAHITGPAPTSELNFESPRIPSHEEAHSSTNNSTASGQD